MIWIVHLRHSYPGPEEYETAFEFSVEMTHGVWIPLKDGRVFFPWSNIAYIEERATRRG